MKSLYVLLYLTLIISNSFAQKLSWQPDENGVSLMEGDQPIYYYQEKTKSLAGEYPRAHYLHPVYGLHGEVLTEDFPEDHFHQRGIFWTWHQIIVEGEPVADGWTCTGIEWKVQNTDTQINEGVAYLESKVSWLCQPPSEDQMVTCVEETATIKYQSTRNAKVFDFHIVLSAVRPGTKIGGSEDVKGYGGFSARIWLPDDLTFANINGAVSPQNEPVKEGQWIDMKGTYDPDGKSQSGVTIMNHPENPQPFAGWILRKSKSMQNAVFPGREPFPLSQDQPLTLKYRLVIHPPGWTTHQVEDIYKDFVDQK